MCVSSIICQRGLNSDTVNITQTTRDQVCVGVSPFFRGKLPKSLKSLQITNSPQLHNKVPCCCDVAVRKFDGICLISSKPNYNGPSCPFLSFEKLFSHLYILLLATKRQFNPL